jgi:DNA-binding transcriptional LysR family regulator
MKNEPLCWDDLRVLLAVHQQRSLLAAGRALGMSTSTAARRIQALERAVGRRLVERHTQGSSLEPAALPLIDLAEQLERGLATTRRDEAEASPLAGTVRLSLGAGFVRYAARTLSDFRRAHPETSIELISETRLVDLARREADIGVRVSRSASSVLIEKSIGRLRFGLFAAQEYLERRLRSGRLRPTDFAQHDFVGYEGALREMPQERWLIDRGATHFPFRSNSDLAVAEACAHGQGIAMLAEPLARDVPGLVHIEVDDSLPSLNVFLTSHRELRKIARVQAVARSLEHAFRAGIA